MPPIIFAAGYTLKRRNFIKNLPFILTLGLVGTFISMAIFSVLIILANNWFYSLPDGQKLTNVECLVMAAVLCATDTVAALTILKESEFPQLNAILFGEGIVNDAVSILIFDTIQK